MSSRRSVLVPDTELNRAAKRFEEEAARWQAALNEARGIEDFHMDWQPGEKAFMKYGDGDVSEVKIKSYDRIHNADLIVYENGADVYEASARLFFRLRKNAEAVSFADCAEFRSTAGAVAIRRFNKENIQLKPMLADVDSNKIQSAKENVPLYELIWRIPECNDTQPQILLAEFLKIGGWAWWALDRESATAMGSHYTLQTLLAAKELKTERQGNCLIIAPAA